VCVCTQYAVVFVCARVGGTLSFAVIGEYCGICYELTGVVNHKDVASCICLESFSFYIFCYFIDIWRCWVQLGISCGEADERCQDISDLWRNIPGPATCNIAAAYRKLQREGLNAHRVWVICIHVRWWLAYVLYWWMWALWNNWALKAWRWFWATKFSKLT
jgi:hypothetical protein